MPQHDEHQNECRTELAVAQEQIKQLEMQLNKHTKILEGNGKDGLCISVSKLADVSAELAQDMWDKETGLMVSIDRLNQKKKDYDGAVAYLQKWQVVWSIVLFVLGVAAGNLRTILEVLRGN